ncbi:MAG: RluA family pseudouridine synthase [Candidatus Staskawiczbacteria bacterium]|nr:RluA family pseudouridine synthase [Candidatus Staskawiczbacteria bacterium]
MPPTLYMDIKIIYEDNDVLVVDKPEGIVVFPEGESLKSGEKTLIDELIEKYPELKNAGDAPRYGIVHRLDKDTSGVLLVAKSTEALLFLQKQFKNREVEKKYVCLVEGEIKDDKGEIKTLIARSPKDGRKQKVYLENEPHPESAREAITEYKVLEDFKDYTLLEVEIKTGRRHQIRCHFSYLQHPVAGDKLYGFKNSKTPKGLTRQFLHAQKLKIQLPGGETKEFLSELPEELKQVKNNLQPSI